MDVFAALVLTGFIIYSLRFSSELVWKRCAHITFISPIIVFLGSVIIRVCGGIWLQVIQPMKSVLTGEYGQYIVARQYVGEVSWMWVIFLLGVMTTILVSKALINRPIGRDGKGESESEAKCSGWFYIGKKDLRVESRDGRRVIGDLVVALLVIFCVEGLVGVVTGATDRGASYSYWSQQAFKPVSVFIGFSRLKQLAYFLVPFCILGSGGKPRRFILVSLTVLAIAPAVVNGSRGELLYPLVMLLMGSLIALRVKRKGMIVGIVCVMLMVPVVPYIAAYRDNPVVIATPAKNVGKRFSLLLNGVSTERFGYRLSALGREIYACSDAFVFKPENSGTRVGFEDLDAEMIKRTLEPRWISSDKDYVKLDGSSIAQRMMGTNIKGWFPCISTPADLWRRGGTAAVYIGGAVIGILLVACEAMWLRQVMRRWNVFSILCIGYPATYYQFPLNGTVREMVWLVGWELVKYMLALLIISVAVERLEEIKERYRGIVKR